MILVDKKPRIKKHDGMWWLLIDPYWARFATWREAMDRVKFILVGRT